MGGIGNGNHRMVGGNVPDPFPRSDDGGAPFAAELVHLFGDVHRSVDEKDDPRVDGRSPAVNGMFDQGPGISPHEAPADDLRQSGQGHGYHVFTRLDVQDVILSYSSMNQSVLGSGHEVDSGTKERGM